MWNAPKNNVLTLCAYRIILPNTMYHLRNVNIGARCLVVFNKATKEYSIFVTLFDARTCGVCATFPGVIVRSPETGSQISRISSVLSLKFVIQLSMCLMNFKLTAVLMIYPCLFTIHLNWHFMTLILFCENLNFELKLRNLDHFIYSMSNGHLNPGWYRSPDILLQSWWLFT